MNPRWDQDPALRRLFFTAAIAVDFVAAAMGAFWRATMGSLRRAHKLLEQRVRQIEDARAADDLRRQREMQAAEKEWHRIYDEGMATVRREMGQLGIRLEGRMDRMQASVLTAIATMAVRTPPAESEDPDEPAENGAHAD